MHLTLLDILRCPFCGMRFNVEENQALDRRRDDIEAGVLSCECCAFPVIAGIPVLIADDATRNAMHTLEAGRREEALFALLGLDDPRSTAFRELLARGDALTYRDAIAVLSPDAEGIYFVYRFSDPTYVMAEAVLSGIMTNPAVTAGRALDLCGGSGHLSRVLNAAGPSGGTVLADLFFFKLWLARRFTTPGIAAVCCDANNPLPFDRNTFSLIVLSDAFPYIWHKRMLADDMMRVAGDRGTILMPHLHSALGENVSPGMPLTPAGYRELFAPHQPRLFSDRRLFEDARTRGAIDLSVPVTPEALGDEPSLTLVVTRHNELFRRYEPLPVPPVRGELKVNPLYRAERQGASQALTLEFPTEGYAEEFGECRSYLADRLTLPADLSPSALGKEYESLRRRRMVLDLPPHYV
jgi:uncharacterized protein YbaR (Trm112 family)/SAM-dependent methyltransferase